MFFIEKNSVKLSKANIWKEVLPLLMQEKTLMMKIIAKLKIKQICVQQ